MNMVVKETNFLNTRECAFGRRCYLCSPLAMRIQHIQCPLTLETNISNAVLYSHFPQQGTTR